MQWQRASKYGDSTWALRAITSGAASDVNASQNALTLQVQFYQPQ